MLTTELLRSGRGVVLAEEAVGPERALTLFFTSGAAAAPVVLVVVDSVRAEVAFAVASPLVDIRDLSGVVVDGTEGFRAAAVAGSGFRAVLLLGTVDDRRSAAEETVFAAGDREDVTGAMEARLVALTAGFRASSVELVDG